MDIKINYCMVTGINNPRILLEGWVTSDVNKLELLCGKLVIWKADYTYTGTKAHAFRVEMAIPQGIFLAVVGSSETARKELIKIPVHIGVRLENRKKVYPNLEGESAEAERCLSGDMPEKKTYAPLVDEEYQQWIAEKEKNCKVEALDPGMFSYRPLISIIIPVYNVEGRYLAQCIDSILGQTYQNFEICLADDCSTNQETIDTLRAYQERDPRIKVCYRTENGHISLASNSALEMASGEYVGLVDNDDLLVGSALAEVVNVLNEDAAIDFIYTDEDKLDIEGKRSEPHFKPDFAIDNFLVSNYICHFSVIRRSCLEEIGGFRKGYEGAQDYDLFLRLINRTRRIYHIPKVLYRWRKIPGSTSVSGSSKNYAVDAGIRALKDYFSEKGMEAHVRSQAETVYCVSYPCPEEVMTDVVIMCDDVEKSKSTIDSWLTQMSYQSYRFVILTKNKNLAKAMEDYNKVVDIRYVNGIAEWNQYAYNSTSRQFLFWNVNNTISDPEWMKILTSYVDSGQFGAVGSNVLNEKTREFASGYVVVNKRKAIPVRNGYIAVGYSPVNRCIVGKTAYLVSQQNFIKAGGFDESLDIDAVHFDLQMKLHNMLKRNLVVPQVYYMQKEDIGWEEDLPEMESMRDFERDPWYNPNLSDVIAYQL